MKPEVLILIPAYNEELTIGSVVALARKYGDVLVVDDGSKDKTSEIARLAGAIVIRHEVNMGKGRALKTGFEYALSKGYDAQQIHGRIQQWKGVQLIPPMSP